MTAELARRYRVLDMMLSAHSMLRDRFSMAAVSLDLLILAVSVLLLLTALLDPAVLQKMAIDAEQARIGLGGLSATVFFLALVQLRVDWKEQATEHRRACRSLAELRTRCRELRDRLDGGVGEQDILAWMRQADDALVALPPIPDARFAALKAAHRRKVALSKLVDRYPGAPLLFLQWKIRVQDMRGLLANSGQNTRAD